MKDVILVLIQLFIGLSGGIAVGSGMVAFLVVLDIIPRLAQISRSYGQIRLYEGALISGSLYWSLADFFSWAVPLPTTITIFVGCFAGCFVGLLAGALTEVINVLPILAKRMGMEGYLIVLLMAMVFGKVLGSLFEWLIY